MRAVLTVARTPSYPLVIPDGWMDDDSLLYPEAELMDKYAARTNLTRLDVCRRFRVLFPDLPPRLVYWLRRGTDWGVRDARLDTGFVEGYGPCRAACDPEVCPLPEDMADWGKPGRNKLLPSTKYLNGTG